MLLRTLLLFLSITLLAAPQFAYALKCSDPGPQCLTAAPVCCVSDDDSVPSCATQTECENRQGGDVVGIPGENGMVAGSQSAADDADDTGDTEEDTDSTQDDDDDSGFPTDDSDESSSSGGALVNPLNADSLPELLGVILDAVVYLGTIVLVLMLVYVGFLFVKAQGKPEEIKKAREALLWTVIGGLLLLGAEGLSIVIQSTVESI